MINVIKVGGKHQNSPSRLGADTRGWGSTGAVRADTLPAVRAILMPAFATASGLLVLAGVRKLSAPDALVPALRALRAPARPVLVRTIAAVEIALGALALLQPTATLAGACAAVYAAFALAQHRLARGAEGADSDPGCGCFGERASGGGSSPRAGSARLAMDLVACAVCALSVLFPPAGVVSLLGRPPAQALALAVGVAGSIYAAHLCFTELPAAWGAYVGEPRARGRGAAVSEAPR
ncbi:MAG: hypothetical protein FWD42_06870 [Solirubrobacterales bacterium]|nr:hypothetical protein [Solirubrobacterales bacterium]